MNGLKAFAAMMVGFALSSAPARPDEKGAARAAEVKPFAPKGLGFSVGFPAAPTTVDKKVELADGGEIVVKCFVAEVGKDRVMLVAVNDIPEEAAEDVDALLEGAVNGFAEGAGGGTPTVKRTVLNGHQGRAFEFEVEGLGKYHGRMYVAGGKMYQVAVAGPDKFADGDAATKFLVSFKLTGPAGKHRD